MIENDKIDFNLFILLGIEYFVLYYIFVNVCDGCIVIINLNGLFCC